MARQPGYLITVKLFIPAPKTDFAAQAKAATLAQAAVAAGGITPDLLAASSVLDVKGQFSSADIPDASPEKKGGDADTKV